MIRDAVRTLWREPRAPGPPARVWRDWVLVGLLVPTALVEGVVQDDVIWRPVALLLALVLPFGLLWRRTHPFLVVAATFGSIIVVDTARLVSGGAGTVGLYVMIWILLLPYSLLRWGAGREVGCGLVLIVTTAALGVAGDWTGVVDAVVGGLVLLFPALLGRQRAHLEHLAQPRDRPDAAAGARSSWRGSCTTPSPTTSRRSWSARRPGGWWRLTAPRRRSRRWR